MGQVAPLTTRSAPDFRNANKIIQNNGHMIVLNFSD
jgi:hypothetical protein